MDVKFPDANALGIPTCTAAPIIGSKTHLPGAFTSSGIGNHLWD